MGDTVGAAGTTAAEVDAGGNTGGGESGRNSGLGLPTPPTRLIGREDDLARAAAQLQRDGARLLTLTGPPGVGKTRLALELARGAVDAFPAGVAFVPLAAISDPALVLPALAAVLGVPEPAGGALVDALVARLAGRRVLLVLDNLEQLPPAGAAAVADLLVRCPDLVVLATSRAPLRLRGEREMAVAPLALPDATAPRTVAGGPDGNRKALESCASVALFLERARDVRPEPAPAAADLEAVAELCRRLDGLPLAIELAAARTKLLPPRALLARIAPALPLLTGGPRDLPARHQTLHSAIAWSYDLLPAGEQAVFRRLGVFVGGFALDAVAALCPAPGTLDMFAWLVDHSLVRLGETRDGEPRFTLLETVREFALDRLAEEGEATDARAAHARYFVALAEGAAEQLHGPQQGAWLDRLEREHDNLRAALRWALERGAAGDAVYGLRLGAALWWSWFVRARLKEGQSWLNDLLAQAPFGGPSPGEASLGGPTLGHGVSAVDAVEARAWARALIGAGWLAEYDNRSPAARELLEAGRLAAEAAGDATGEARALLGQALLGQALVDVHADHRDTARPTLQRALQAARTAGDSHLVAMAVNTLGFIDLLQGDLPAARVRLEEALALRRGAGDDWGVATSLSDLGKVAQLEGDIDAAREHYQESLAIRRRIGHAYGLLMSLSGLARVETAAGDFVAAHRYLDERLALPRPEIDAESDFSAIMGQGGDQEARFQLLRGGVAAEAGDAVAAAAAFRRCLEAAGPLPADRRGIQANVCVWYTQTALAGLSWVAAARGDLRAAARLGGAANGTAFQGLPLVPILRVWFGFHDRWQEPARRAALEGHEGAWAEGQATPLPEMIEEALALAGAVEATAPTPAAETVPAASPAAAPGGLSPREREVAILVARGHTNPQIARALVIAPRTAMRHVEHVMAKLRVHSRAQVAAWAAAEGLLASTEPAER